ncbi:ABC transporter permease [Mucilaginibacter phyllosphaerae]|uniref:ABC transport system permease protein n=1 Tax=Mucilaginibacter phyllosphaerae TaxID=1812349 RepID=A0A4Y8ADL6_9SPHI|nr:ABC transporter permease [Mucilaginibacter phyllosphaerae]MBB3970276.1 putative ABC transport system permease protein [Mucilaginibacter phyllosphaerae]TEW66653.1 FtsX-like permease family protein [Mucilaginibacter phyllosphaerae]GGH10984.1 ABC transporter permease [Mucilaginibacter phyllosphaerae]
MLRNLLLVTYRNLVKNKSYTLLNVIGLSLGIAAFIVISAYVHFEKSYDSMYPDGNRIYRVESRFYRSGELTDSWASASNGYGKAMYDNLPGIASYARISWADNERDVRYGDIKYREQRVCFADSNFLSFFALPLLKGNAATALRDINSVIISAASAKKYFGSSAAAIGKTMQIATQFNTNSCMVTGVFKDLPVNSTLQFNMLVSFATAPAWVKEFWYQHNNYTFLKLKPKASPGAIEQQFPAMAERFKTEKPLKELKWAVQLTPLPSIHLNPIKPYEMEVKGNRSAVNFLQIMAYVILLIACINYINLATTKSVDRAREVGIRKVSGAHTSQLVLQFFIESFIINLLSLGFATLLVILMKQLLQQISGDGKSYQLLIDSGLLIKIGLVFICSVLLSGIYPATVLSGLKPIKVLKGRFAFSKSGVWLRKGMVSFQFAASFLLLAGTLAVYRQLNFMNSQQTGVNLKQTIVLKAPSVTGNYLEKVNGFKSSAASLAGVQEVSISGAVPGKQVAMAAACRRYGTSKADERTYDMLRVDFDFIKMYQLQLVAGRNYNPTNPGDTTKLILNETAVKQFGFASAQDAVGKKIWVESLDQEPNEIIGVIKDYHQQSLKDAYFATVLFMDPKLTWVPLKYISVKADQAQLTQINQKLKQTWEDFFPGSSFDYFFLDDFYARQYEQDIHFGQVFMLFSSMAIVIACLGLFGLTSYSTARRRKEIGVRKVLGASAQSIVQMLAGDMFKLIVTSSVIAIPLAVILIYQWLQGYAFKVQITWWQFVVPVIVLMLISFSATIVLTYRAAQTNPVKTLRDE